VGLLERQDSGELSKDQVAEQLSKLLDIRSMRNLSVGWNLTACRKLTEKSPATGDNQIERAWMKAYGDIFDEKFQAAAKLKQAEILGRENNDFQDLLELANEELDYTAEYARLPFREIENRRLHLRKGSFFVFCETVLIFDHCFICQM
jgi:hypothetical protein